MPIETRTEYKYRGTEHELQPRGFNLPIKLTRHGGKHAYVEEISWFWEGQEIREKRRRKAQEWARLSGWGIKFDCPMAIFPPLSGDVCFYDIKKLLKIILGDALFQRIESDKDPIVVSFKDFVLGEGDEYSGMTLSVTSNDPSPVVQSELKEIGDLIYNYFNDRMGVIYKTVSQVERARASQSFFGRYETAHSNFTRKILFKPDGRDTVEDDKRVERPRG
jgi:hypothetical protein